MAIYPCDVGAHRYGGPQQTIYPAIGSSTSTERRKLRLCPGHFDTFLQILEEHAFDATIDAVDLKDLKCLSCHEPCDKPGASFFATVYPFHAERREFWGPLHPECVAAALEDWALAS